MTGKQWILNLMVWMVLLPFFVMGMLGFWVYEKITGREF